MSSNVEMNIRYYILYTLIKNTLLLRMRRVFLHFC